MVDSLVALIVDEGKWLTISMGLALLSVGWLLVAHRSARIPVRRRVLAAMSLFFGVTIGVMASGHLLAVTTKLVLGTLEGSVGAFYTIGVALAVPSWWLIYHTRNVLREDGNERTTLGLNCWVVITLLALGVHNLPLAVPGFLNVGYQLNSKRAVGWAIVCLAIVANVGLFIGSVIFLASGQSFEDFRGIR